MIKTIHAYLSRDLAKVTGLALIAFTLVMTVFSIMEPLRKRGLGTDQVIALFSFTLPVMLTLTLPVAALFAATIVYGRFSQDNELLACRASGISTVSLLKPALLLGGLVTVASLALSNFVAPQLAAMGEKAVKANVRGIIYHKLRSRGYVDFQKYILHADEVFPEENMLRGVVAVDTKKPDDIKLLVASTAFVDFNTDQDEAYVTIHLINPAGLQTSKGEISQMGSFTVERPLPSLTRDKAAFYDWAHLLKILAQPAHHREIRQRLEGLRHRICHEMLATDIASAINSAGIYDKLRGGLERYVIRAAGAQVDTEGFVRLAAGTSASGDHQRVEVTVLKGGLEIQRIVADSGKVMARWSRFVGRNSLAQGSHVSVELAGEVEVHALPDASGGTRPQRPGEWVRGEILLPRDIVDKSDRISLHGIYEHPRQYTTNPKTLRAIEDLKNHKIRKIRNQVLAEIHGRLAYGMSCFLLVAMGAALGVIFRGGQMVSAFAISIVPASIVIVMMIMGKHMIVTPGVPVPAGLASIWGGILALVAANTVIYVYLMRK